MKKLAVVVALAGALAPGVFASPASATSFCPADVGVGDPNIADPWLLTSDVERPKSGTPTRMATATPAFATLAHHDNEVERARKLRSDEPPR